MTDLLRNVRKYLKLLFLFAKNSLSAQLEYRVNFLAGIFVETGFMLAKITYVVVIYKVGVSINGMTPDYILLFIGTYAIMTGIYMSFFHNFTSIPGYIKDGTLDVFITKPVSLLFMTTTRYIDFAMPIPNIAAGIIMVCIGWSRCGIPVTGFRIAGFLFFIIVGTVLTYGVFLLPRLLSFWFVSSNGVSQLCDSVWDFNNMPMGIYNRVIRGIGTFLFPVFLITNVPGLFIGGRLSDSLFLWAFAAPFLFLGILSAVWKRALKKYTSASS